MSRVAVVSVCQLHQWSLDFEGNLSRIKESILMCKKQNSALRIGPELEISGYSCDDHFFEYDTIHHSYHAVAEILADDRFYDIVIDLGLPVVHKSTRYNCRMICLNGKILLVRPKKVLANDGCYSEWRWFACWLKDGPLEEWIVPHVISRVTKQTSVPFGIAILQFNDTVVGHETCEELFIPDSLHQTMVLNGAEIVLNSSGSHFVIGKIKNRLQLVNSASSKGGCLYLYANCIGCDAGRMYFDGGSFISHRGVPIIMLPQHKIPASGVEVATCAVELEEIRADRASRVSWMNSASHVKRLPKVYVEYNLCHTNTVVSTYNINQPPLNYSLSDDLLKGPACWLWSYFTRSGYNGFILPLSGGADSTAVGVIMYTLSCILYEQINKGVVSSDVDQRNDAKLLLGTLRRVTKTHVSPKSAREICKCLLTTVYLGNHPISSEETRIRASSFAQEIGCEHLEIPINNVVETTVNTISKYLKLPAPQFRLNGGTLEQDLSLQNIQARSRLMITRFYKNRHESLKGRKLLMLGTGNADEIIRGYLTKYDCSAADINPIGSVGKKQIRQILEFATSVYQLKVPQEVLEAIPSAELVPAKKCNGSSDGKTFEIQSDEVDMEISYESLNLLRHIRKSELCGPRAMFRKLVSMFNAGDDYICNNFHSIDELAHLVKKFFIFYATNRHKTPIQPPSVHIHDDSADDNRYDMRPIVYNAQWTWQFKKIDEINENFRNHSSPKK